MSMFPKTPSTTTATVELWPEPNNVTGSGWQSYDLDTTDTNGEALDLRACWRAPSYGHVSIQGARPVMFLTVEDAEKFAAAILTVCQLVRDHLDAHPGDTPTPTETTLF